MISRWFGSKPKAVALRKQGVSMGAIETTLGIPRSTLSGWFKDIQLSKKQQQALAKRARQALIRARKRAVAWHNAQKAGRLSEAQLQAADILKKIPNGDTVSLELALAFLYLGEGAKRDGQTSLGNANPVILRFFLSSLYQLYDCKPEQIKCYLHLRADQNDKAMKRYWSKALQIPIGRFGKTSFDMRTKGRATYQTYKGVCLIECSRVAIQRRLRYIANGFCERIGTQKLLAKGG